MGEHHLKTIAIVIGCLFVLAVQGCSTVTLPQGDKTDLASNDKPTSGFTYVPLDPIGVELQSPTAADLTMTQLLNLLPDNAVRMSVQTFDANGNVTYGPVAVAASGYTYRIVVDYVNADTVSIPIFVRKIPSENNSFQYEVRRVPYEFATEKVASADEIMEYSRYNIPVYVGIGLRVTADVKVVGGKVNISGLGVLGAAAEANQLTGTLVVQSLGVTGKSITGAMPIQSELNRTTAQNAVLAIGSVKTLLYDKDTQVTPRVVGMYLPLEGDKVLINAIMSELANTPIPWRPTATSVKSKPAA
jgi:hypothetical protein